MSRRLLIARCGVVTGATAAGFAFGCGGESTTPTLPALTGRLRGSVVDTAGKPQGIGRIYLLAKTGLNTGTFADVDAAGMFDFGNVAVGDYLVRFWGDNRGEVPEPLPNPVRVTVAANAPTVVNFQIVATTDPDPDHDIFIGDYFFQDQPVGAPNGTVVAKLGTVICWYNVGQVLHSVTGGPWGDSGPIGIDGSFNWTSDQVGTFPYRCRYHGTQMIATLQIVP